MKKINEIRSAYILKGVSEDNADYAISAVKDGAKREHIIESLTADYRGMNEKTATEMLEELFQANGGEFIKENRGGYIYAAFFLLVGLSCCFYLYYVYTYGGVIVKPVIIWGLAIFGTIGGLIYFLLSLMGKYRDSDEPFTGE